ncbi:MAG TPA: YbhB/YbcL family Raf kinase inhibitor-like protein [Steroidobacteraceae bacterium]|nr:YbhB/YbcL family Raf kinase inhibitor-like protein [Steroidobacteraceae bacterium]
MKTLLISLGIWCASLTAVAAEFRLSSPDIAPGGTIASKFVYKGFGCSGENVSPALNWTGAPAGTRSFALLVHDADAPTGGAGWWHWLVYNIPAGATNLAQGAGTADGAGLPTGSVQGRTDFGSPGWGGPCPPAGHGVHHYRFTLYALKTARLDVSEGASAALIGYMANANAIGKARLMGLFSR